MSWSVCQVVLRESSWLTCVALIKADKVLAKSAKQFWEGAGVMNLVRNRARLRPWNWDIQPRSHRMSQHGLSSTYRYRAPSCD